MLKPTRRRLLSSESIYKYCLGLLSTTQARQISRLARQYPTIRQRIDQTLEALRRYSTPNDFVARPSDTQQLLHTLRELAETPIEARSLPPLNQWADVGQWRQAVSHLQPPADFDDMHVHVLRDDPALTQWLVWVRKEVSVEEHLHEQESILILWGYCRGYVGTEVLQLAPGDYLAIPTGVAHSLQVTEGPVQLIVQRLKPATSQ